MVTKKETPEVEVDPWVVTPEGEKIGRAEYRPGAVIVPDRDRLTITLKAGTGFDAPWLVYHASSVEEGLDFLGHERFDELADLTARKGKELARAFGGSTGFSKPAGGASTGYSKPAASTPAGAVEWDAEEGEYTCVHGGATQVKGESAKGPWTGYFCPQPKDATDKCTPKFLNKKR